MTSFQQRSYQKELLDRDDIPFSDIRRNMEELEYINRTLGGHRITIRGFSQFIDRHSDDPIHVVEIGCGGGDNLYAIQQWAERKNISVQLTGVDLNPECVNYARMKAQNRKIHFICSNYRDLVFDEKPQIIFSSLFCHHFTNEELVYMLRWMHVNSEAGFFINDLHRHTLAYHSIKFLTKCFSGSYLVRNDAPLSVQRAFVRKDWDELFQKAALTGYQCRWAWAFRWLVWYRHHE